MFNQFKNTKILAVAFFVTFVLLPSYANAQASTSTGRSAGITDTFNDNHFRAMERIRNHINKGEFDRAESRSLRIIRTEDRNSRGGLSKSDFYKDAYNAYCVSLVGQGEIEEAMNACNTSIELNPKSWESLKSRATLYYMIQDFPKSLADFELSLEHAPDNAELAEVLKQNIAVVQSKIN